MASPSTQTTLLTLPRELRDLIYEHVFTPRSAGDRVQIMSNTGPDSKKLQGRSEAPGVLLVCKQIRAECIIPYLRFSCFETYTTEVARTWLLSMPLSSHKYVQELCISSCAVFWIDYHGIHRSVELLERKRQQWNCSYHLQLCQGVLKAKCITLRGEDFIFGSVKELEEKKDW